jgi:hypothetical protein
MRHHRCLMSAGVFTILAMLGSVLSAREPGPWPIVDVRIPTPHGMSYCLVLALRAAAKGHPRLAAEAPGVSRESRPALT